MNAVAASMERLAVQREELAGLWRLFHVTPKVGRLEIAKAAQSLTTEILTPCIVNSQASAEEIPAVIPDPLVFGELPPVRDMFKGMVWGENKTVFMQLEHLVNSMRKEASTRHLGLYGPPSVGKTLTAGRIAKALDRRYYEGSASFLSDFSSPIEGLAVLIDRLHDGAPVLDSHPHPTGRGLVQVLAPTVFFIDEAHELPTAVQNALLPLMEDPHRTPFEKDYLDFRNVMFILGTTDPAFLLKPLRSRCTAMNFIGYSCASVAQMVRMKYPELSDADAVLMARAGKLYPRRALSIASICVSLADSYGSASAVLIEHMGIDTEGLDNTDRQILEVLTNSRVTPSPVKAAEYRMLVEMHNEGTKISPGKLAAARAFLSTPGAFRPLGRQMLAEKIMVTNSRDIFERVTYLETLGKVVQTSRGIQLAG